MTTSPTKAPTTVRTETIDLHEWIPAVVPGSDLAEREARRLVEDYRGVLRIERPPFDRDSWLLTSLGHVGSIAIDRDRTLMLHPKTPVGNLFRMLEVAYMLDYRHWLFDPLRSCAGLPDFFDSLALILAERILLRARRGLHRSYEAREDRLGTLRGRLDLPRHIRADWRPELPCRFEEHTVDNDDNRILLQALDAIARSPLLSERVSPAVRRARRLLARDVSPSHEPMERGTARHYTRLNRDYEPLHALSRFFIENVGPAHTIGERRTLSFLIDMGSLFERFVTEWLRPRPELRERGLRLSYQERTVVDRSSGLSFVFDILLKDVESGRTLAVLDTKYKTPDRPANDDIYQVVAYATQQGCAEGILIYPEPLRTPVDTFVGGVRVRSLPFSIAGSSARELERAGKKLIQEMLLNEK